MRQQVDYLFEPPLEDIGLRDWQAFDRAVAEGYAHAMSVMEKKGVPFSDLWVAAHSQPNERAQPVIEMPDQDAPLVPALPQAAR